MFFHNLKYSLKTLFRNKILIFWTYAFPIILGLLFHLAFSSIEKNESLGVIDIAVVDTESFEENISMKMAIELLSNEENENQLFHTQYVTEQQAGELLENDEIVGYLFIGEKEEKVVVKSSGIYETIFKTVIEEIQQNSLLLQTLIVNDSLQDNQLIDQELSKIINRSSANIKDISASNMSYTMIEFYTLIAMACLYGGMLGSIAMNQNLANMSSKGKRVAITPLSKAKVVCSSVLAGYITQIIGVALLLLFTIFVLHVDYGNHIFPIILLALTGSLAGLSLGVFVAVLVRANENIKTGIILSITMLGCFLSGMMGITMKYIIDTHIPLLNKINPASMITDGFYALYYYHTFNRYWFDIASLLIFSSVLIFVSFIGLRRQKYDSI